MRRINTAFGNLLAVIGEDINSSPELARSAIYEPSPHADWVTKQIQITIKR